MYVLRRDADATLHGRLRAKRLPFLLGARKLLGSSAPSLTRKLLCSLSEACANRWGYTKRRLRLAVYAVQNCSNEIPKKYRVEEVRRR